MAVYCGVDFHSRQQFVMWCDTRDGEAHERQLAHKSLDGVRSFYSQFTGEVIVGLEAGGYSEWFETMLDGPGHQVWVGNATEVRRRARSRQKTDHRDAQLLLGLLLRGEFPRINRRPRESYVACATATATYSHAPPCATRSGPLRSAPASCSRPGCARGWGGRSSASYR